jgi:hypothetical protein
MIQIRSTIAVSLLWVALAPLQAWAQEADPFAGLIQGTRMTEEELESYNGRGFELGFDGGVNSGSASQAISSTVTGGAFGGARGIMQVTQFNGDGNHVEVTVNLEVNINTTTISNSQGLSVGVTNGFSLSGGTSGIAIGPP